MKTEFSIWKHFSRHKYLDDTDAGVSIMSTILLISTYEPDHLLEMRTSYYIHPAKNEHDWHYGINTDDNLVGKRITDLG